MRTRLEEVKAHIDANREALESIKEQKVLQAYKEDEAARLKSALPAECLEMDSSIAETEQNIATVCCWLRRHDTF